MTTITITFGDQAENHAGMQKIGTEAAEGYTVDELYQIYDKLVENDDIDIELCRLDERDNEEQEPAAVLIIHNGVDNLMGIDSDELLAELEQLQYDKHAYMYGRVVNKKARWNLCFDETGQDPDYENKKGTIVSYDDVELLKDFKDKMGDFFGEKARNLAAEANYYYDINNCGIGYHGDGERKIVIAFRLGATIPLRFQWYLRHKPVGKYKTFNLQHGDIYIMSEKAVGTDWKKTSIYTLRHAAGCEKYIKVEK